MHKCLDEVEFLQDPTTDYRVSCPCASQKSMYNVVNIFDQIFFILAGKKDNQKVWNEFEI